MQQGNQPFSIPDIRNFVPEKLKPWIVVLFAFTFQLSGGVYMSAVAEMAGSTALLQEDIMMAGYAGLVGMSLAFCLMFRISFRFSTKNILLTTSAFIAVSTIACTYITNVPLLVGLCFVTGFARMIGIFGCNHLINLWITPKREMAIWFSFIYFQVQCSMQLTGIVTISMAAFAKWEYMNLLMAGALGALFVITTIIFRHYHSMPKMPLLGIDWLGGLMWGLSILCFVFVCNYGDYYDWFESVYIRIAVVGGLLIFALNIWRASFIRHPYINFTVLTNKSIVRLFLMYFLLYLLLSPEHVLEHVYTEGILGYDALNSISLNWPVLLGSAVGSLFCYLTFGKRQWRYKTMMMIGFSLAVVYLLMFYFTVDYNLPKESMYLPLFCRGLSYVICAICLLTSVSQAGLSFPDFAQGLTMHGFAGAAMAGVFGSAVLGRAFKYTLQKNAMVLSGALDNLNIQAKHMHTGELYGAWQQHAVALSIKELYGWLAIIGIGLLVIFAFWDSSLRPTAIHPKWRTVRKLFRNQLRSNAE